jgi:hypothetical protein
MMENEQYDLKSYNLEDGSWFCIHYADFCYGDASNESCHSYEEAAQKVLKKPKRSDIAYQYWREHKALFTKPVNRNATWTNEHTKSNPESGHLFIWG